MSKRSETAEFETSNGGEWGSVKRTARGYTVERHSRYQGTRTGVRLFVPMAIAPAGADEALGEALGEGAAADVLRFVAAHDVETLKIRGVRVLARGFVVQ